MTTKTMDALHQMTITEEGPGTILRDFETLLDFVGVDGIKTGGKHHLLPMSRLRELDERLTHPLRPPLKRPQQRSFPHIQGLYLLLRATTLGRTSGTGGKARLSIDPHVLTLWRDLNATERYFNLLEAWLLRATSEMLGGRGSTWHRGFLTDALQWLTVAQQRRRRFREREAREQLCLHSHDRLCLLGLMELFGFVDVERGVPDEGENWRIQSVKWTAFGNAVFELLRENLVSTMLDPERMEGASDFGQWQPLFSKYFPQWRKSLTLPEPEFRDGVHCFKASLGKVWRRIVIPASADMDELARCLIAAFDFDGDHLYCFHLRDRDGTSLTIAHPYCDDRLFTDEVPVGAAPLEIGDAFTFLYDFGADWRFSVTLERVDPPDPSLKEAKTVQSRGEAPPEYHFEDDDWDDDYAEEDEADDED
jgi:hypothetical protein